MLNKNVSIRERRYFKIAVSQAALGTESPVNEAVGTTDDEIRLVMLLRRAGIHVDKVSILPISQVEERTASPFSTSAFGLNLDYVNLAEVPEFLENSLKSLLSYLRYPPSCGEIDIKKARVQKLTLLLAASRNFHARILRDGALFGGDNRAESYQKFLEGAIVDLDGYRYNWLKSNAVFYLVQQEMIKRGYGPDFREWPQEYRTPGTEAVTRFKETHEREIEDYCYIQFVCHEQQLKTAEAYRRAGIKREVNLPFGCDPCAGAEVWALQGRLFDTRYNVGCYVEPLNGYDEQNWGMPQYIPGKVFEDFLRARYRYLAQYVDSIFIDHLCGFANKYYFPADETGKGTKDGKVPAKGFFEMPLYETDLTNRGEMPLPEAVTAEELHHDDYKHRVRDLMAENVYRVLKIVLEAGLEVDGETIGDPERQSAVEEAIRRLNYEGNVIPLMYVLMYKDRGGEFANVQELLFIYEIFSGTHDTPNLLQMLCNRRGDEELWFKERFPYLIANFLSQGLGILASPNRTPLKPGHFTREMGMAMLERISSSTAGTFTVTLQDLFALLLPDIFGTSDVLTINRPSTSSAVGNPNRNFSMRFPRVQLLLEDDELVEFLRYISQRPRITIDYPDRLIPVEGYRDFYALAARYSAGRKIVYWEMVGPKWKVYENKESKEPVLEMMVANTSNDLQSGRVKLPETLSSKVQRGKQYRLVDLTSPYKTEYERTGDELLDGLYIMLSTKTEHHFVVYEIP